MADIALQTAYRDEFIAGFATRQSLLRQTVSVEAIVKGNQATFLVSLPNRRATTRGANGRIPTSQGSLAQVTATLIEKHDLVEKTQFNVWAGQGDQRRILQMESMGVINREIDLDILTELANATVNTGGAATMSKTLVNTALTKLFNGKVPNDGNIWGVISPAAWFYLSDLATFTSRDYIGDTSKPLVVGPQVIKWLNVNWIMHPELTGVGTASCTCFIYHKAAIGHAVASQDIQAFADYDQKQDSSWARTSIYAGAKILQSSGIVKVAHNDSALS